jgi:hypothetical protein
MPDFLAFHSCWRPCYVVCAHRSVCGLACSAVTDLAREPQRAALKCRLYQVSRQKRIRNIRTPSI